MNCPTCHTAIADNARFCTHCGTMLAMPPSSSAGAKPAYAPPASAPPPHSAPAYAPPAYSAPPPAYSAPPAYAPPAFAAPPASAAAAPTAAGDPASLLQRILNITLKPKTEWPAIAAEPAAPARILVGIVMPLAAIQAVLGFIHRAVIGISVPFVGNVRMPITSSLTVAVMGFVFALIGMFLLALIVNAWAPVFAARRNLGEALKVAAYAAVPGWLGSFFGILPVLGVLLGLLAGLYAIYVLYLGLPVVMRGPKEKALGYTVAVILTGIVCGVVLGALAGAVGGFSQFGAMRPSAQARADESAAITGNVLGGLLGTDDKGKAALGAALGGLARAGQEAERAERAAAATAPQPTPAEMAARSQRDAAQVGNVIGGMLGTDPQGRAALGAALGNLAKAGQQAQAGTAAPADATVASAQGGNGAVADPAATGAAVGGLLNALGGALGGSKRVTPVDFRSLGALLPDSLNGQPRGPVEGANKQAMGVKGSSASARYGSGAGRIELTINDVSGVAGLMDIANGLEQTTDAQTADGFERDIKLGGRRVHEKYSNAGKSGELSVIVAKRFEVGLKGSGVDMATLEAALGQVDLGRLEAMKDAGAQN